MKETIRTMHKLGFTFEDSIFTQKRFKGSRVMVFNATFNNISVISRRSVLLVEETTVPGENY